jgi:hypothetical protein
MSSGNLEDRIKKVKKIELVGKLIVNYASNKGASRYT